MNGPLELPQERQMISMKPDVVVHEIGEDLMFIVLACDGIWDVLGNQEVADFVISKMATGMEPEIICEELMTRCLAPDSSMGGLGCDNMTVILVCFLHNQTYEKLVEDCIQIEKIREDSRLRLIREAHEKSKDDDAENISEDTVNSVIKENNEENPGHHSDAKISGDATDS